LLEGPRRPRHADDRDVEVPALHHRLERWEDLLVGEVARGPEEDQGVGPPNVLRVEVLNGHHALVVVRRVAGAPAARSAGRSYARRSPTRSTVRSAGGSVASACGSCASWPCRGETAVTRCSQT